MRLFQDDFTQEMLMQDEASRKAELAQKRKALSGAQKRMEDLDSKTGAACKHGKTGVIVTTPVLPGNFFTSL